MNVLIIEDETPAAEKLERYLNRLNQNITVIDKLTSIRDSVNWLEKKQDSVDLIFMDIQLIDGKSFEIFDHVDIQKPIIFITAFDEYALEAFKVNSIDYLLKPITFQDLEKSIDKLNMLKDQVNDRPAINIYEALAQLQQKTYKNRFMVKLGEHIKSIAIADISLFYAEGRDAY